MGCNTAKNLRHSIEVAETNKAMVFVAAALEDSRTEAQTLGNNSREKHCYRHFLDRMSIVETMQQKDDIDDHFSKRLRERTYLWLLERSERLRWDVLHDEWCKYSKEVLFL